MKLFKKAISHSASFLNVKMLSSIVERLMYIKTNS